MTTTEAAPKPFDPWEGREAPEVLEGPPIDWGAPAALFEPPAYVRARPIVGNGIVEIRKWIAAVEAHFGGQNLATCYYASLIGYHANLKKFTVDVTDRKLAESMGMRRQRVEGHAQRLVDAGFLYVDQPATRGRAAKYRLGVPDVSTSTDPEATW